MPNIECSISNEEIGQLYNPADDPDFLNASYVEPVKQPKAWCQLLIYVGNTAYDFARHYVSKSYSDELIWASRSSCKFQIDDNNKAGFNLPFVPTRFQKVILKDLTGASVIGYWFIRNVFKRPYGQQREDGTYMRIIEVECEDAWSLMESKTYSYNYTNVAAGYVLYDAVTRAGLDGSQIDQTAGPTLEAFAVNDDYPSAVAERIMSLLDWTYWLDVQYDPPRVYAGSKDSELTQANLVIDELNWSKVFDPNSFELNPAMEDYANEVLMKYRRKHTKGGANFQNGSNVVVGFTGDEDWAQLNVSDSLEIENTATGAVYRVQKNNSDSAGTNELILSSNYAEANATNAAYIIRGALTPIRRRDDQAIERMQGIRGGDGIRSKVIVRDDAPYSYAEAALIASFELSLYSREYYRGKGLIATSYNADWLHFYPGKTLPINLPTSHGVVASVRQETIRRQDLGSPQTFADGRQCFAMSIDLDFTPSMYTDYEQIRALFRSTRKLQTTTSSYITDVDFFENWLAMKDCAHIIEPIGDLDDDDSVMEVETEAAPLEWPDAIAYTELDYTYHPGYLSITAG